jgi:hypothetical protein
MIQDSGLFNAWLRQVSLDKQAQVDEKVEILNIWCQTTTTHSLDHVNTLIPYKDRFV